MGVPDGYKFPDVSRYRTVSDWGLYTRTYPVSMCKASEGSSHKDPYFPSWRTSMRQHGAFPIGYHFLKRSGSIGDQVTNFLQAVEDGADFGVMLDVETAGDGSNPTIQQANDWFKEVERRTGIPLDCMICYLPRWWYQSFGGGQKIVAGTVLHNSHFSSSPNCSDFAGHEVEIIQYSSTAPIAGLASPGTGDMNSAIGMTSGDLIARVTGGDSMGLTDPEHKMLEDINKRSIAMMKAVRGDDDADQELVDGFREHIRTVLREEFDKDTGYGKPVRQALGEKGYDGSMKALEEAGLYTPPVDAPPVEPPVDPA